MNAKTDHRFLAAPIFAAQEPEAAIDAWTLDEVDLPDLGSLHSALAGGDASSA
jgi:hypothetical protein